MPKGFGHHTLRLCFTSGLSPTERVRGMRGFHRKYKLETLANSKPRHTLFFFCSLMHDMIAVVSAFFFTECHLHQFQKNIINFPSHFEGPDAPAVIFTSKTHFTAQHLTYLVQQRHVPLGVCQRRFKAPVQPCAFLRECHLLGLRIGKKYLQSPWKC